MNHILVVDQARLDALCGEAQAAPRKRKNYNFHAHNEEPSHRILNAMEPETYVQPHQHADPHKDETVALLRGKLGVIEFDAQGRVTGKVILSAGGDAVAISVPHGTFHGWVCLAPGSVFLEAKGGPYLPLTEAEKAPWAPPEGDPRAAEYLAHLKSLFA